MYTRRDGLASVAEAADRQQFVPRDQDEVRMMFLSMRATRDAARRGEHIAGWRLDAGRGAILREYIAPFRHRSLLSCSTFGLSMVSFVQVRRHGGRAEGGMRPWEENRAEKHSCRRVLRGKTPINLWNVRDERAHFRGLLLFSILNTGAPCTKGVVEARREEEAAVAVHEGLQEVIAVAEMEAMMRRIRIATVIRCLHVALPQETAGYIPFICSAGWTQLACLCQILGSSEVFLGW